MKYNSIQLLRAVAALMVVVFHSKSAMGSAEIRDMLWWWPGLSDYGDSGVALFFVISGFIIASVFDRPNFSLKNYIWQRLWRIYPLYWLVMGAGFAMLSWRNWFRADVERLGIEGIVKSFLILPQGPFPFWQPGWSLEHELLFYLIAALVAPLFGLVALAFVVTALGFVGLFGLVDGHEFHLFYYGQIHFGAGVLAYLLRGASWKLAGPVALVLLVSAYGQLYGFFSFPHQIRTLCFGLGFTSVIVALVDFERRGWQVPGPAIAVGDASYSLYLWHWLVIPFAAWGRSTQGGHPEMWRWIIVLVSIVVALLSFRLIEKPLIELGRRKWRPSQSVPAE